MNLHLKHVVVGLLLMTYFTSSAPLDGSKTKKAKRRGRGRSKTQEVCKDACPVPDLQSGILDLILLSGEIEGKNPSLTLIHSTKLSVGKAAHHLKMLRKIHKVDPINTPFLSQKMKIMKKIRRSLKAFKSKKGWTTEKINTAYSKIGHVLLLVDLLLDTVKEQRKGLHGVYRDQSKHAAKLEATSEAVQMLRCHTRQLSLVQGVKTRSNDDCTRKSDRKIFKGLDQDHDHLVKDQLANIIYTQTGKILGDVKKILANIENTLKVSSE